MSHIVKNRSQSGGTVILAVVGALLFGPPAWAASSLETRALSGEFDLEARLRSSLETAALEASAIPASAEHRTGVPSEEALLELMGDDCRAPDGTQYFTRFSEMFGPIADVDLEGLVNQVYDGRAQQGAFGESNLPPDTSLPSKLVQAAAVDTALSRWHGSHIEALITTSDTPRTPVAIVARARCQLGSQNAALLQRFIEEEGFPSAGVYGDAVAQAGLLALKHADPGSAIVDEYADLAEIAFEEGNIERVPYAFLLDSLARLRGQPMIFGTYIRCVEGHATVSGEIAEPDTVDARRAEFGLWALSEQLALIEPHCAEWE